MSPRKVTVATTIFGPTGAYPGPMARAGELTTLVDAMAERAEDGLDLVVLPETVLTTTAGPAADRALPMEHLAVQALGDVARRHSTYLVLGMDIAESGRFFNAAVLFDRGGQIAGIYRKVHPVAVVGSDELEGGLTPGAEYPVFDCDFGRLGIQICWDVVYPEGWAALADAGAEIIAWPSASPATLLPSAYAARHRYYVVSSTPKDNATVFEPTGMIAAQAEQGILVHRIDLRYAILGWSSFLADGAALKDEYGNRVGIHYQAREDLGLFYSNDPDCDIEEMIAAIGGEGIDEQIARNRRLQDAARASHLGE